MAVLALIVMVLVGVVAFFTVTTLIDLKVTNRKLRQDTKRAFYAAGRMDEALNSLLSTNALLGNSDAQQEIAIFARKWRDDMKDVLSDS